MSGRILVVTNDFPPRVGGIESFVASLCAGLPSDQLVVYTASMPRDSEFDATLDYPVIRDRARCLLPTPRVGRAVQDVVRRYGCDRVVFGAAAPLGLLAPALRETGVRRLIGLTHGHEVWWAQLPVSRGLLRRVGDGVDVLTYVTEYCHRRIAPALSQSAADAMVQLSPGVQVEDFDGHAGRDRVRRAAGISSDRRVVLAASRLVARKGHDSLLRVWPQVIRGAPDSVLLIVGSGPQERRLHRLATQSGHHGTVRFLPGVAWWQMPEVYAAADVFALPCRTRRGGLEVEALGIVFLEAAASGLPVVVGASGGAPETVVDGVTGYVVDHHQPTDLADRLLSLLRSPERAAAMGAAGRLRMATEWSSAMAVERLRRLLD